MMNGLTTTQAEALLREHGANALAQAKPPGPWRIFFRQFKDAMVLILLAATGVSAALGDFFAPPPPKLKPGNPQTKNIAAGGERARGHTGPRLRQNGTHNRTNWRATDDRSCSGPASETT